VHALAHVDRPDRASLAGAGAALPWQDWLSI
jgi:hypothetical protein